ncbi:MAG: hypothetical protein MUP22_14150, partial [Desulfobacterales bacterium]|nr:hypothetical protein [Desulfobacterales bacterium]
MKSIKNTGYRQNGSILYLGVGLISLCVLMLEIGLTRIFSVMFESHYAFLIISLAILGLGLGGVFVHKRIVNTPSPDLDFIRNYLHVSSGLMALSILLMLIFILKIPLFQHIYLTAILAFIPFFFGGVFLATAFRLYPDKSAYIYATDLVGASIGSVLIVALLNLGAIKISLLVAVLASLPACFFIIKGTGLKSRKIATLLLTGVLFIFSYFSASLGTIPFAKGAHKEMARLVGHPARTASVIESRWSAFGRTDLITEKDNPDEKVFFIDGTAGTSMYGFNKELSALDKPEFKHFSGYFPFEVLPEKKKEKILIIGAGGGREVLISLLGGAKEVT